MENQTVIHKGEFFELNTPLRYDVFDKSFQKKANSTEVTGESRFSYHGKKFLPYMLEVISGSFDVPQQIQNLHNSIRINNTELRRHIPYNRWSDNFEDPSYIPIIARYIYLPDDVLYSFIKKYGYEYADMTLDNNLVLPNTEFKVLIHFVAIK